MSVDWVEYWASGWERAKDKAKKKVSASAQEWKEGATSPKAQTKYITEVVRAAVEGRREKGLERVNPNDWAKRTIAGIEKKQITDLDKQKMAANAAPYIDLIKEIRKEFKKIAFPSWKEAALFWQEYVNGYLKLAKRNPEKVPDIRNQIMQKINEYKSKYGEKSLSASDRKSLVSRVLGEIGSVG